MGMGIVTEMGMGIDCMGMGGNGNVKSHSRTSLRHTPESDKDTVDFKQW